MTQMTPQELAERDEVVVAMASTMITKISSELEKELDPEDAVYSYLYIQDFCSMAGLVVPPFEGLAPLVKLDANSFEAVKVKALARKLFNDKESDREVKMDLARMRVEAAIAQYGEESDQVRKEMVKAIQFLPADVKAELDASARALGLMPPASGYLENGDPVFTVEDMAKHFGMEPEQVMQDAAEFSMTVDANSVHRPQ